jgi:hypothetical protein
VTRRISREPFTDGLAYYLDAGWSVVPVKGKVPLVKGFTGAEGGWPSDADVLYWCEHHWWANIAIRFWPDFIGLDNDDYKPDPHGDRARFWNELDLPDTWSSGARHGRSGIYVYQVPEGVRFTADPAPGVEIVQFRHRTAVVWPSVHVDLKLPYRWWRPDGRPARDGVVPRPDQMAELPARAVRLLEAKPAGAEGSSAWTPPSREAGWTDATTAAWCKQLVANAQLRMDRGWSRHETARKISFTLVGCELAGYPIASAALADLGRIFVTAATDAERPNVRSLAKADQEWTELVEGARRRHLADQKASAT